MSHFSIPYSKDDSQAEAEIKNSRSNNFVLCFCYIVRGEVVNKMYLKKWYFYKKITTPVDNSYFFPLTTKKCQMKFLDTDLLLDKSYGQPHGFILKVKIMVKIVISMHNLIFLTTCQNTNSKTPKKWSQKFSFA